MNELDTIRVLVVEDHGLLADSLSAALRLEGYEVGVPPRLDDRAVLAEAETFQPHVTLLDLHLDDHATSLGLIPRLRDAGSSVVMVTSERARVALAECVEAGAIGLVDKGAPFEDLLRTVHDVARLRTVLSRNERDELLATLRDHRRTEASRLAPFEQLTPRECDVLTGIIDGLAVEAIAERNFVAVATVRSQIRSVLSKLGVRSQLAAAAVARAAGWKPPD